ncbi:unnamed protein product [Oppiella nova]|uniref:Phosphatidylinositol-specific phospholipase C X domain-containing protein n=1 Tax=Oppiella nova TaxID=334625 RepID=A0A7R9MCB7_9ACAR|nr:unnamed protein product [Oppiella nova]CAG2174614.1 unnamed protein product [Oppiella nova]
MENNLSIIGDKKLPSLVIPGTHDSGSYEKWGPKSVGDIIRGFTITQDESIYNQLVYGIRYLDMRVGYHNVSGYDDKLWIVHDIVRTDVTLRSAAEQVKDFLKAAPKEIVIFDFHRFVTGFLDEKNVEILKKRYKEFFDIISSELKDLMIPFSLGYGVTVNELIRKNKRVLIGFDINARKYLFNELLWPNVRQQWGEKDELQPLIQYFEDTLCTDNKNTLRSAMAELTPTMEGIFKLKYKSLRHLALLTNAEFTNWFSDRWPTCVNIIAADYFLSSNVVDIALSVNHRNSIHQKQFKRFHSFY